MQGILLGIALILSVGCLYMQFKRNADELRATELEEQLERQEATNAQLIEQLQNRKIKIEVVKTYGY